MKGLNFSYRKSRFKILKLFALMLGISVLIIEVGYAQKMNQNELLENFSEDSPSDPNYPVLSYLHLEKKSSDAITTPPIEIDWDWKKLLEEPDFFGEGCSIIQMGIGLISTVNVKERAAEQDQIEANFFLPSLHIMYERQVWQNVGAGISFGTRMWKVPILDYQYRYYTIGLRGSYHLNIIDDLDPYVALGTTYRRMVLANSDRNEKESKFTVHFVIGSRYYFTERIAGHLEIGNDLTSWTKLGLAYYIY